MNNIRAELKNLRDNQIYEVQYVSPGLAELQIKGTFNIKFPFGFNKGISSEKVNFIKAERQLLLNNYEIYGAAAKWSLSVYYGNLPEPIVLILDFSELSFNDISLEIGFKITPLLDRCRNFEKTNELISFTPQNYTITNKIAQSMRCHFQHNGLATTTKSIANIQGEGLIDADGLEYNIAIPDFNDAIALFRITQKTASQAASYFNLDIKFQHLTIMRWLENGTITLKLKTDYLFYYDDSTHDYVNILNDSCSSSQLYVSADVQNAGVLPKNVDFSTLPYDTAKTLTECYIVTYLEIVAPLAILQNAIRIWSDFIFINHDFVQTDDVIKGVRVSDYLRKVNELSDSPIFHDYILFVLDDIIISSTNFMLGFNSSLKGSLMDVLETLTVCRGFSFLEVGNAYILSTIAVIDSLGTPIELTNFRDVNYTPVEQILDFEIGDDTKVNFEILPRLFEKRKYYVDIDSFANLDTMVIPKAITISGEVIINKLIDHAYDDELLFMKIENVNVGDFGPLLNEYFSSKNIIDRLEKLLKSFFATNIATLKYRNADNQIVSHNFLGEPKLFSRYYRNITTAATSDVISQLVSEYHPFKIGERKYIPIDYSINLEPNTVNMKLLEVL